MNDATTMLNWFNDIIFVSLVNTTLQITLLITLVALLIWIFRIKSPAIRYSLWLFALSAIVILPLLTPFIPQIYSIRSDHQEADNHRPDDMIGMGMGSGGVTDLAKNDISAPSANAEKAISKDTDTSIINPVSAAYFIWCAGVLFMSYITVEVYRKLRRLRMCSSDVEDQASLEMLSRLRDRLSIRRRVTLKESSGIYSPISMGIISPVIIIPDRSVDGCSVDQLEMILTHELAHIKRHDYLVSLVQNIARVIFFFHPFFYLLNRRLAKEREHICDDWVIGTTGHRNGYAECIVGLLEKAVYKPANIPAIVAMAERKRDIPGRIDMIVDRGRKLSTGISRKVLIGILIIGCLCLPVIGGIELVRFAIAKPASDEGQIVFAREGNGIWVMDTDGKSEKQIIANGTHANFSSDGSQIAFCSIVAFAVSDIYIINTDGSNIKRLTDGPGSKESPTLSPDGEQIAFSINIFEENKGEWTSGAIYVMDLDSSNLKKLKEDLMIFGNTDWSQDGKKIAFEDRGLLGDRAPRVWVMNADGSDQKMINNWGDQPAWSPDGRRIAFSSGQAGWAGGWQSFDIYVMDEDGSNVKILTDPGPSSEFNPAWSPDGTRLAFSSNRDGNYEIYVMDADGSNVQRITNTTQDEWCLDWTASSYAVESAGKLKSTWGKVKQGLFSP